LLVLHGASAVLMVASAVVETYYFRSDQNADPAFYYAPRLTVAMVGHFLLSFFRYNFSQKIF
jgi:hypothetical protein